MKFTGLTLVEARITEQALISAYTLDNLRNARRSIAAKNIRGVSEYMGSTIKLFGSTSEVEMLNLLGR